MTVTEAALREAEARMQQARSAIAVAARYDRRIGRVVVRLNSGLEIAFSPHDVQGLERSRPADLDTIAISPSGLGLYFPRLDADIYVPALLQGLTGSRAWMTARAQAAGDRSKRSGAAMASAQ